MPRPSLTTPLRLANRRLLRNTPRDDAAGRGAGRSTPHRGRMKLGLGIALAVTWMLFAAWLAGPQAGGSFILGIWILGLVSAACVYRFVAWCLGIQSYNTWQAPEPPHAFADRLGRLADAEREPFRGKVRTLTPAQREAEHKRIFELIHGAKERGPARIASFPPKGAA